MLSGAIEAISRSRVESRRDERLATAWVEEPRVPVSWPSGVWLGNAPSREWEPKAEVVLVFSSDNDWGRTVARAHAELGARVYVLAGQKGAARESDEELMRSGCVLLRRIPAVPATAVYARGEARVDLGAGLALKLESGQAAALRELFFWSFWHEATEEGFVDGGVVRWRAPGERPFDVRRPGSSSPVRVGDGEIPLRGLARACRPRKKEAISKCRRLWFPAGPSHHDWLAELRGNGLDVVSDELELGELWVDGTEGEVALGREKLRLGIRLVPEQVDEFVEFLESRPVAWRFSTNLGLGDEEGRGRRLWLAGERRPRGVEVEQRVEVGVVQASTLRAMHETEPATLPQGDALALAVRYTWTVLPPRAPRNASADPLVLRWQKFDEERTARLRGAKELLGRIEEDRTRLFERFENQRSAMLGLGRARGELAARLEALEAAEVSGRSPEDVKDWLVGLEELEREAGELETELKRAEGAAKKEEERERQKEEWRADVARARADGERAKRERERVEQEKAAIEAEIREVRRRLESVEGREKKDAEVELDKLRGDLERKEKDARALEERILECEEGANRPFEFRPTPRGMKEGFGNNKKKSKGGFIPRGKVAGPSIDVPEEALPATGSLLTYRGQRYLVIETWEQLDIGEREALRLGAKLVAVEET